MIPGSGEVRCMGGSTRFTSFLKILCLATFAWAQCFAVFCEETADVSARVDCLNRQAVDDVLQGRYPAAEKLCTAAMQLLHSGSGKQNAHWRAVTTSHLAYINYLNHKYDAAIR